MAAWAAAAKAHTPPSSTVTAQSYQTSSEEERSAWPTPQQMQQRLEAQQQQQEQQQWQPGWSASTGAAADYEEDEPFEVGAGEAGPEVEWVADEAWDEAATGGWEDDEGGGERVLDRPRLAGKRLPAEVRCFDTARIYVKGGDGGKV